MRLKGILLSIIVWSASSTAAELVYTPVNPSFGGNPLNGSYLLNNAQAQDDTEKDEGKGGTSALERFNEMLQRAVLNRLAASTTSSIVGPSGELIPGTIETTDFIIQIVDLGGGLLEITTTDKQTGDSTSFQINSGF